MTNIGKDVEERKSLCTAGRDGTGTANMENSIWGLHENFKTELPCNLVITLQGIFLKKTKTLI